jgi:hypothetical protein
MASLLIKRMTQIILKTFEKSWFRLVEISLFCVSLLSFCPFSFRHCIVLSFLLRFMASDYPFAVKETTARQLAKSEKRKYTKQRKLKIGQNKLHSRPG